MTKNLFAMTVLSAGMALAQAPAAAPAPMSAPPTKVAVIQIQAALAATKAPGRRPKWSCSAASKSGSQPRQPF